MAARSGSRSHEGMYSSSPPSSDPHDPFSNSQAADPRYYDNESEHDYGRGNRDTYGSDSSNVNEDDRYYDQSGGYDGYGREYTALFHLAATSCINPLVSPTRHRLRRRRLWPEVCTIIGVAGTTSHGDIRGFYTDVYRLWAWQSRAVSRMGFRAPNTAFEGGDRGHFLGFNTEVWFPKGFDEEHGKSSPNKSHLCAR